MDLSKLPREYYCYCFEDMAEILRKYPYYILYKASIGQYDDEIVNPQAQKAILVKIEVGINEFKEYTQIQRIDALIAFWDDIEFINSQLDTFGLIGISSISQGIIEIAMGQRLYSFDAPLPDKNVIDYAISIMKENNLDHQKLLDIYNSALEFDNK